MAIGAAILIIMAQILSFPSNIHLERINSELVDAIFTSRGIEYFKVERIESIPLFSPFVQSWFCNNCNYRTKQYLRTTFDLSTKVKCSYCNNENVRIAH